MPGQKPMSQRMQEMLADLQRSNGRRVSCLDRKVLNRLIKKGDAKIVGGARAVISNGLKHVWANAARAVATHIPEEKEEVDTGGPFAKKKAELDEAGVHYRGKNLGRKKVVGERKLTKQQKKKLEKQRMWEKLKK